MSLTDKVIVVTGGTSGIGEACTTHFAQLGNKVVFASIQADQGAEMQQKLQAAGLDAIFVETDVTDETAVAALVKDSLAAYGRIDCLMSNAGAWREGKVTDFSDDEYNFIFGVNVKGNFLLLKHIVPVMEQQGKGTVLITTSVAAFVGFPAHALYCASKASLDALIRCMATDYAGIIRTVGICPGTIDTPMLRASCAGWDIPEEELLADVAKKIPVRRLGTPDDVAKAAAFLLSDDAGYINGSSLMMEGGTLALPPW
jgi:NAD(P)-dependent dehydrogenase (short-subunit alcohol dehydrogenase family)